MTVTLDDSAGTANAITTDVLTVGIAMPTAMQDVTAVGSSAMERLYLLADLQITLGGVFDDGDSLAHATLKDYRTMAGTELGRTFTLVHSGQTLTHAALKPNDYNLTRAADGSFTWTTTLMCANGSVPAWS